MSYRIKKTQIIEKFKLDWIFNSDNVLKPHSYNCFFVRWVFFLKKYSAIQVNNQKIILNSNILCKKKNKIISPIPLYNSIFKKIKIFFF